jgi:DNA (cytosine-5)-methyltransferase 1
MKDHSIRAIDLFAGIGGSSCGAKAAGVTIKAAVDCWSLARNVYKENFSDVRFIESKCEDVDVESLKKKVGRIDLIIASPECTSHTCAKGSAPRSETSRRTAYQIVRFAEVFKPRWIIVENVVHMKTWRSYKAWLGRLMGLGYNVRAQVINAADHGVPQARRRLFILCDLEQKPPQVQPTKKRKKTARSVLDKNGHFAFSPLRTDNRAVPTLERADRAIGTIGHAEPFLLVYYGSDAAGGWQKLDVPLRTVTTVDRFAYVRPSGDGHEMRMLQVPEVKAAMGFPKRYALEHGTRREKIKLLGNAVCPPVMSAVISALTGSTTDEKR